MNRVGLLLYSGHLYNKVILAVILFSLLSKFWVPNRKKYPEIAVKFTAKFVTLTVIFTVSYRQPSCTASYRKNYGKLKTV